MNTLNHRSAFLLCLVITFAAATPTLGQLRAGAAKVDVTDYQAGPVHDPLFVKALVLESRDTPQAPTRVAIVTIDAVAIGEIGRIGNDFLPTVRQQLLDAAGVKPDHLLVNASHCHGVVRRDIAALTVQAVRLAAERLEPVRVGCGVGNEDRIMENRRLLMKGGGEIDVRHAYAMPPDQHVAGVGPIDPQIGILRLDRVTGGTLAVLFNFACHPIQSVPGDHNTADLSGIAATVVEQNMGSDCVALFVQGCGGDINPVYYKDVAHPRSAVPLGQMLGLSTLAAARKIKLDASAAAAEPTANEPPNKPHKVLAWHSETRQLPRADLGPKILEMQAQRERLAGQLTGSTLNIKTFLQLSAKYGMGGEHPSYFSHAYLQQQARGREDLLQLDRVNRAAMQRYLKNIHTMELLTRVNTNLRLLEKHHAQNLAAESRTVDVQLTGLRVGEFVMTSFPGELTVQIGLNLKAASPHKHTFVAGYSNGYIYYAPTTQQLQNVGGAQEDSDCILAPHWQKMYEQYALELLKKL